MLQLCGSLMPSAADCVAKKRVKSGSCVAKRSLRVPKLLHNCPFWPPNCHTTGGGTLRDRRLAASLPRQLCGVWIVETPWDGVPHPSPSCRLWADVPPLRHTQKIHGKPSHNSHRAYLGGPFAPNHNILYLLAKCRLASRLVVSQSGAYGGAADHVLPIKWSKMGYTASSSSPQTNPKHSIGELPKIYTSKDWKGGHAIPRRISTHR